MHSDLQPGQLLPPSTSQPDTTCSTPILLSAGAPNGQTPKRKLPQVFSTPFTLPQSKCQFLPLSKGEAPHIGSAYKLEPLQGVGTILNPCENFTVFIGRNSDNLYIECIGVVYLVGNSVEEGLHNIDIGDGKKWVAYDPYNILVSCDIGFKGKSVKY